MSLVGLLAGIPERLLGLQKLFFAVLMNQELGK
jgi:hypothetical protein